MAFWSTFHIYLFSFWIVLSLVSFSFMFITFYVRSYPSLKNMIIFLLKIAAYTFHVGKYRMCHTEKTKDRLSIEGKDD